MELGKTQLFLHLDTVIFVEFPRRFRSDRIVH
jgi:hypothetical protein